MRSLIPSLSRGTLLGAILILALLGFADSVFLLAEKMDGGPIPCVLGTGCDTVSNSPYSLLFGIPLAAYGVAFYVTVGIIALIYLDTKKMFWGRVLFLATTAGFLMSVYFIYVQKFLIGAFCVYCIISAVIATLLFCAAIVLRKKS